MEKLNTIPDSLLIGYMYHMNKKMEIRNVDVSKQAFCGKGGYTNLLKILWGRLGYRNKISQFFSEKADNNKGI